MHAAPTRAPWDTGARRQSVVLATSIATEGWEARNSAAARMRLAEKDRHLSNDRARLGHIGNHRSVLDHFKLAVDQHIEPTSRLASRMI